MHRYLQRLAMGHKMFHLQNLRRARKRFALSESIAFSAVCFRNKIYLYFIDNLLFITVLLRSLLH